ncbi:MAG: peptidoglycan-binding domain-containing protein, partial [bacterium]|nr:peptidoglycan-binding domain-containing protein [bacterium]
ATPSTGSTFSGWVSGGCAGSAPCTRALTGNTSVNAIFMLLPSSSSPKPTTPSSAPAPAQLSEAGTLGGQAFTQTLKLGDRTPEVQKLQEFLITEGLLPDTARTGFFGPLTQTALITFQRNSGSISSSERGITGTATRSLINAKLTARASTTPSIAIANNQNSKISFTKPLKLGSRGADVQNLQIFLNTNGFTVAPTGAGSKGLETTYFGPATARAVTRFQEAYRSEILTPNNLSRGTGYFGPSTLRKLNTLLK